MKIVIVGGGLSGWISALILSNKHPDISFTIIESEDVKTIGVGEGTTGHFVPEIINENLGITYEEFFRETKATPKMGIEFNDWNELGQSYFNPIDGSITQHDPIDTATMVNYLLDSYLDASTLHGQLRRQGKTPFYKGKHKLVTFATALHLDNAATISYLKKKSLNARNLEIVNATVKNINRDPEGNVISLECGNNLTVEGDLFIDCSGFSRIFSTKDDWVSFKENLPMNKVTVFTRPHNGDIDLVTKANAASSGWMWEIPTQERIGCGYVHCDSFIDESGVESEILSRYQDADIKRSFSFDSGKLKKSWNNNVVSLGLSYHFLEPLQATNIHLTLMQLQILSVKCIVNDKERTLNKYCIDHYNKVVDDMIENFKHYINAHYTGRRTDSEFWKMISKGDHITEFTKQIIGMAKNRGMHRDDFTYTFGSTGVALWAYTIYGMGHVSREECLRVLTERRFYEYGRKELLRVQEMADTPMLSYDELIAKISKV